MCVNLTGQNYSFLLSPACRQAGFFAKDSTTNTRAKGSIVIKNE
jgi:hypothetical protein